jgi:hypothetical protein
VTHLYLFYEGNAGGPRQESSAGMKPGFKPEAEGFCPLFPSTRQALWGPGGLAAVVLSRVCPKGRAEGAPLTGSGRPPDNLAPGRGEKRPVWHSPGSSGSYHDSNARARLVLGAVPGAA